MKILFFFPRLEPSKQYHYMPISALAVSAELLEQGHEVTIWDDRVDFIPDKSLGALVFSADQIMISAYTGYQLLQGYEFIRMVKDVAPHKKIILGGPHATALPTQTLADPYIDEVVTGEVDTGAYPLPLHLIDVQKYINPETERFMYITSYGCPGQCTFCATEPRRPYLPLPMERVRGDIDNIMAQYPFKECVFFDATLFTKPERVKQVVAIMKRHNLQWIADARATEMAKADNSLLNMCVNSGLKHGGLTQLTIGLESGSPRIVEMMKKGKFHLRMFRLAAEKLANLAIKTDAKTPANPPIKTVSGVVLGCPGETPEDLQLTIDYIKQIRGINPNFFISTTFFRPLPCTAMAKMAEGYGYRPPQSLEEWAMAGQASHYNYNRWNDSPWIKAPDKYREIYEAFKAENQNIFV